MDFVRLVQSAAAADAIPAPSTSRETVSLLDQHLDRLRSAALSPDTDPTDRPALAFYKLLIQTVGHRDRR